ncbi:MAG: hypothetical protein AB1640_16660 [bacterium]
MRTSCDSLSHAVGIPSGRGHALRTRTTWAALAGLLLLPLSFPSRAAAQEYKVTAFKIISQNGGRVDWDPSGSDRIAFDKKNADGFYDVYTIRSDGTGLVSLTDGRAGIWQRQNGNPAWHASGKYIVFQSEHPEHVLMNDKWSPDPGVGVHCELWATNPDGSSFWQLTQHEVKKRILFDDTVAMGVLNPKFTRDGSTLLWTERFSKGGKWGRWRIWMADFVVDPQKGPSLRNQRVVFTPTEAMGHYVTCMGMTLDKKKLLFAGGLSGQDEFGMDLYLFDLASKALVNLTNDPNEWTEGSAITPDGKKIVYTSNKGYPHNYQDKHWYWQKVKREYWMMNLDGSNKQQVTHCNTPGHLEYSQRPLIVTDCSWSPDGRRLASTVGEDMGGPEKAEFQLRVGVFTFSVSP